MSAQFRVVVYKGEIAGISDKKSKLPVLAKWRLKSMSYINVDDVTKLFYAKLWEENSYFLNYDWLSGLLVKASV